MKDWYKSKTIWANIVALVVAILALTGIGVDTETQAEIVVTVMSVVNLVLRFFTDTSIK